MTLNYPQTTLRRTARQELTWFVQTSRPPRLRTLREFALAEVVIPEGQFEGRRMRVERQPYTGLLFDAIDSGLWPRVAILGCVQSGKSLSGWVIPLLYHLFEVKETVICGLPSMDLARDKWREEILPVIERTRYRDLLPERGQGSRGGDFNSITFRHGPTLKFMSGGGGDEKRSSFTARVVVITEADKMDEVGGTSREADKIAQLEARTLSFDDDQRRIYMECTVSIEEGRIWQEYQAGTRSRIVCPCPCCGAWVTPERDTLKGWENAESKIEARSGAHWQCPECGEHWDDDQRRAMNLGAKLLHRGQQIAPDGTIEGEPIRTDTLGVRWNAFNNLFWSTGSIAAKEWAASREMDDPDNADRELRQFYWAVPAKPPEWDETPLSQQGLLERVVKRPRGQVPAWCERFTVGVDIGKYLAHWQAIAWKLDGTGHTVEYGRFEVPSDHLAVEQAIYTALLEFGERVKAGWTQEENPHPIMPEQVWIDARYKGKAVYAACQKLGSDHFRPTLGYGAGQERYKSYPSPKQLNQTVRFIGEGYHLVLHPAERVTTVEVNADHWKSWYHARLATPLDASGAMTLFQALPTEHLAYFKHLTAEKEVHEPVPGKGYLTKWIAVRNQNHWFDAGYLACAAAHWSGVRLIEGGPQPAGQQPTVRDWFARQQKPRRK